jgi:prepilin-type processing-associated H-X9-DG protein
MGFRKVFLKKDLFVLFVSVLFLVVVCGMVGKRGRDLAKRSVCASNINQLLQGLTILAGENDGELISYGGYWPWDVHYDTTNALLDCMGIGVRKPSADKDIPVQDVFYCPSNLKQKIQRGYCWSFAVDPVQETGYRLMGYFFLLAAGWNNYGDNPVQGSGDKKYVKTIYVDNPSETELVVDIILSDKRTILWPQEEYPNGNFAILMCGGMPCPYCIPDTSNHLKTPREPYGINIGFVDGHVAWRPFSQMEIRFGHGICPVCWW